MKLRKLYLLPFSASFVRKFVDNIFSGQTLAELFELLGYALGLAAFAFFFLAGHVALVTFDLALLLVNLISFLLSLGHALIMFLALSEIAIISAAA